MLTCDVTVHALKKKKKRKKKGKHGFGNAEPNPHLILKYRIKWMLPLNGLL